MEVTPQIVGKKASKHNRQQLEVLELLVWK